jgi:hypothetical protein
LRLLHRCLVLDGAAGSIPSLLGPPTRFDFDSLIAILMAAYTEIVESPRIFYDVIVENEVRVVKVKAVGHKEHGVLGIVDREVQL